MTFFTRIYHSPVGPLEITATAGAVVSALFVNAQKKPAPGRAETGSCAVIEQCIGELDAYFAGQRQTFSVPLAPEGTAFQQRAWAALQTIPYGQTVTYGHQARLLGDPNASRAVGLANGNNPINILVPCHRVIGAGGSLTGYGGDLWVKRWLLDHEQKHAEAAQLRLF